jgi:hypothetical protein
MTAAAGTTAMPTARTLAPLLTTGALVAGATLAVPPARAASSGCEENVGYEISSPSSYRETGFTSVVVGLRAVTRTVTFSPGEGCLLDVGDGWAVSTPYFTASGRYDGTVTSLSAPVRVAVPRSDRAAGPHPAVVTLTDVTAAGADVTVEAGIVLKRRTELRRFNVWRESPAPRCGVVRGTLLHARSRLVRASWTRRAYGPVGGRPVSLLFSPGHTDVHDLEDGVVATRRTGPRGWALFSFRPGFDATYEAHHGATGASSHADSRRDFVDCSR